VRKAFILLITLGLIAMNVVLSLSDSEESAEAIAIAENQIYLEDVRLNRTEPDGKGYAVVLADSAYFDRNNNRVMLNNTELEYTDGINTLVSRADEGQYILDERLITKGHITGNWNNMAFQLGDNGTFEYNFPTGSGAFRDNVVVRQGAENGSTIRADEVRFNTNTQNVRFSGKVNMYYTGEKI
jgi:lipopolysaccharide export system protein LptC